MNNRTQLGEDLQSTCTHCGSVFRISSEQLEIARGQARCGECMQVFNALINLENYNGQTTQKSTAVTDLEDAQQEIFSASDDPTTNEDGSLSLSEAMFGDEQHSRHSLKPIIWIMGILLLLIISVIQLVYYQRYQLISSAQYQHQILNLCRLLPCDEKRFSSPSQIRMVERNVFSHPTRDKALMVTGSFVNDAPFDQTMPGLLISLSDIKGNLIANRHFKASEYLTDKSQLRLHSGKAAQFKLEIMDPGTEALTYEFEFVS